MNNYLSSHIDKLKEAGNFRTIPGCLPSKEFLDLSSNDYLGLSSRWKEMLPSFFEEFPDYGFSSSASRLLCSKQEAYILMENYLRELYGRPALLYNSGSHANVGIVSSLAKLPNTLMICDKLVHASVIDGIKMSGTPFQRFSHNDLKSLSKIIEKEKNNYERIIIIVEAVYSMEGDVSPLRELCRLKKEYKNIFLYVDEAHAFGVKGEKGLGLSEALGVIPEIDILAGTLGKAAASAGAFVICDNLMKDFLINTSRSFIFSTALPPVNIAWSLFMIKKFIGMREERERLSLLSKKIKETIEKITGRENPSSSQIIPLVTGNTENALKIASVLKEKHKIIALPIRRPTVPPGKEGIRFSLRADLTDEDIERLQKALTDISDILK